MTGDVQTSSAHCGCGKTVLVVEDDPRLRRMTLGRLVDLGYRALEASDGTSALQALREHPETDILFSDIVMPGEMSGLELARRVRKLYPKLPIVLTSGYSAELLNGGNEGLDVQILRKPYRQAELVRALREAADGR
jgi:CheY-like chemotaxis protein